MSLAGLLHSKLVYGGRVQRLVEHLSQHLAPSARVLDVGCGDGWLSSKLRARVQGLEISGIDVLVRPKTYIPVQEFDGRTIPYPDCSFDTVMMVDVLHHADNPGAVLREAARCARKSVLIKDHFREGLAANARLRFMDWVGNAHIGVSLPYNYWNRAEWAREFASAGLTLVSRQDKLGLYPWPATLVFDAQLHFVAELVPQRIVAG